MGQRPGQSASRRPSSTAHDPNKHLGWAEITHPFHPRLGQRFPVVKVRRVSGIESLTLRGTSGGTLCVPREWTDRAEVSASTDLGTSAPIFDIEGLLSVVELLEEITRRGEGEVDR